MVGVSADGIGFATRHTLNQVGGEVFVRLVGTQLPGQFGGFEELLKRHESTEDGRVFLRAAQIFEPRGRNIGPPGED